MATWLQELKKPSLNWLLICVPITIVLRYATTGNDALIFVFACTAIIPLAGWMGRATEHLAHHAGETVGGLINATFGNAAELIIALFALHRGMLDVVKASLTGSIIGNILLVLGAAFLAGGVRHKVQTFNPMNARMQSTLLMLAAIGLVAPAVFHYLVGGGQAALERDLSTEISVVLIIAYGLSLLFSLHTHKNLMGGTVAVEGDAGTPGDSEHGAVWPVKKGLIVLLIATAVLAWMSEMLIGAVEITAHEFGMNNLFVGVIIVAIVGNAAEHSTAILAAMKNRMDLSLSIAIGSSTQVALFVAPVLVFAGLLMGRSMDLVFSPAEVLAVVAAVFVTSQISNDGESNWLEGVMLLAVYAVLALMFFMMPMSAAAHATGH